LISQVSRVCVLSPCSVFLSFFFYCSLHHLDLHSFPTRRSSDLSLLENGRLKAGDLVGLFSYGSGAMAEFYSANVVEGYEKQLHRSEEHTSELQSRFDLVCRLLLEKKNNTQTICDEKETTLIQSQ